MFIVLENKKTDLAQKEYMFTKADSISRECPPNYSKFLSPSSHPFHCSGSEHRVINRYR
jgi:hypothetical protein